MPSELSATILSVPTDFDEVSELRVPAELHRRVAAILSVAAEACGGFLDNKYAR